MLDRRNFIVAGAAASTASAIASAQENTDDSSNASANSIVRVGVMGLSRGQALALDFARLESVEVAYLCDVDQNRSDSAVRQFNDKHGYAPQAVRDFREILDDPQVDALVCAAPNHWHGPATIMACKAGKHVYVEKPCSHNPLEGEWMVQAAEQFERCVQMGTQRRSSAGTQTAIAKLHDGAIGKVHLARCYYNSLRGTIGRGTISDPPPHLDYDLWQGPAPRRPYQSNVIPYNWHWFWHWGGGELANNGVHGLDLCRWGLNVDFPIRTISSGGRYWFDDDQETPDVHSVCFEFEDAKQITWDALSCNRHAPEYMCAFYGDGGSLELDSDGMYRMYNVDDKRIEEGSEKSGGQVEHLQNFVDAIRANDSTRLNQPITEGHKSTLLCHLGNIAHRTGKAVESDPTNGRPKDIGVNHPMWRRQYDPAWESRVSMPN